ncbi:hypothetical protein BG015_002720 [Linnemannia schmuckeri]|uniref:Replication factor C subunit 1 n=1 Tax=Linnemannia schmuckeri TaxID=64567 RepID=A0A9P5VDK7_9FUNG|nr:hypothetical protein BG015_002720 [Linnemannia schmuckeri]
MDLRNYFSAKPKPKATSAPAAEPEPEKKRTSTRKKTIIHDSDEDDDQDEVVLVKSKHFAAATPSKAASAKKEVVEEPVDPKAFFASSKAKKSQPATTATSTTQSASGPSPSKPIEKQTKKEPIEEAKAPVEPTKPQPPAKRTKKANDDDYFSDDSDVEVIPQPKSRTTPARTKVETPAPPPSNKRTVAASSPKKRKGPVNDDYEDDEDEDDEVVAKPTKRQKSTPKKPKDDNAMDVDEPEEKPKAKFNFWAHKNKAGPSALGSKEIPKGEDNCLAGLTFVFTGELSSITREDATDLVKRYSGRVTGSPSGKTSYVVVGDDAGQSKLDKVKKLKIKTLDEDGFLDLIRTSPARTEDGEIVKSKPKPAATIISSSSSSAKVKAEPVEAKSSSSSSKTAVASEPSTIKSIKSESKAPVIDNNRPAETELWTSKYRPKQIKDLCGNNAGVQKLVRWLENWDDNYKLDFKKENADKSGTFRAVLISGPPGVGKTSAAHLVGESLGYNIVEFNASDTRSKKSLDTDVRDLLDNQSLGGYFLNGNSSQGKGKEVNNKAPSMAKKQLIIMDEVDGMAGGDRGGIAQMIAFIKKTQVPIICICNDRQSPKVRSLVNSCFDMRFQRPQVNQVRSRLLSILHREGRQIPANVLDKLVSGSQSDIRQVLNMLSTWSLTKQTMDYDEGTALSKASEKYVALNPFQIAEQLLVNTNYRALSFADKFDTYFNDYQLAPLMIQENYVRMNPAESGGSPDSLETMELMSKAADSLSDADLVDSMIHGSAQHWSLMNTHAAFSCVRPAFFVHGNMRPGSGGNYGPMMQFPSYLGQYSKSAKYSRLVKEVQIRMRLKISGDKNEVRQNYIPALFPALTRPLIDVGADAVPGLIEFMDDYYLCKEDWDTILELGIGRNDAKAVLEKIPTQVKTAFTRKYNSTTHPQPYLKATVVTKGRGPSGGGGSEETPDNLDVVEADAEVPEEEDPAAEDAEEESVEKDKNIKQKKVKGAASKGKATAKASSASKGKATNSSRSRK